MKKLSIVLTRSSKDGKEWLKVLKKENLEVFCIPVQTYRFKRKIDFEISKDDVIIFTSTKGIEGFLKFSKEKILNCIVLGEREESLAKKYGFNVLFKSKFPNASSLAEEILEKLKKNKKIIYIASELYNKEFEKKLKDNGFDIKVLITYKPVKRKILKKSLKIIKDCTDIIFFSPSQVQNFFIQIHFSILKNKRFWAIGKTTFGKLKEFTNCNLLKEPKPESFLKEIFKEG